MNGTVNNGVSYDSGGYPQQHQQPLPQPPNAQHQPQTWAMQRQSSHQSQTNFYGAPQGAQQAPPQHHAPPGHPPNSQMGHYPPQQVPTYREPTSAPYYPQQQQQQPPQQHSYPVYQPQSEQQSQQQVMRPAPAPVQNQIHHGAPLMAPNDTQPPNWPPQPVPPHQVDAGYQSGALPPPAVYNERLESPSMNQQQQQQPMPTPPAPVPHSYTPDTIHSNSNNSTTMYHNNNTHQQPPPPPPVYPTEVSSAASTPGVAYNAPGPGAYGNQYNSSSYYHPNGSGPTNEAVVNARACQPGTPQSYWSGQNSQQQPPPGAASAPPIIYPPAQSPHMNPQAPNNQQQQLHVPLRNQSLPPHNLLDHNQQHTPSPHYYYSRSPYEQQPPAAGYPHLSTQQPPSGPPHPNGLGHSGGQHQQFAPHPNQQEPVMHHHHQQPHNEHPMQMNPHNSNHMHHHQGLPYGAPQNQPPLQHHMQYPNNMMHPQHMMQNHHHQSPHQATPTGPQHQMHHQMQGAVGPPQHPMQNQHHPMQLPPQLPHNHHLPPPHHHQMSSVNHQTQVAQIGVDHQQPPAPPTTGKVRGSKKGAAAAAGAGGAQPKSTPTRKRPYMTEKHKQSGYAKFYQIKRKELGVDDFAQASKQISDLWNKLSDEERSVYAQDVSNKRKEMLKKKASQQAQNLLIGTRLDD